MTRAPRRISTLLAAFALAAAVTPGATACAQRDTRTRVDTTFAFNKGGWVDLGNVSGEIVVTGWTRPEARVSARLDRDGYLETTLNSDRISIHTRSRNRRLGEAHYEVMVPIGARVQASSVSGDIRIKATAGEVEVNSTSGDVEVLDARDRINIQTISGDVHAEKLTGRTGVSTTSGSLQIDDVSGDLSVHTVSSEITLRNVNSSQVYAGTVSGEITYSGTVDPKGNYQFNSHSGDVRVDIPANSGANLQLQSFSGTIKSQFRMTMEPGSTSRRGKRYEFTVGAGGARISIETFSGDITIGRNGRSGREE